MPFGKQSKAKEPENLEKAYEYTVFLLSLKLRTIGEVLKKMEGRGYTALIVEEVIERLKSQKYLDDERYAEIFLENLKAYKNYGYYGVKKKLMEKRLPSHIIERILSEGLTTEEEEKIARRFLKKEGLDAKEKSVSGEEITYRGFGYDEDGQKTLKHSSRKRDSGIRAQQKTANRLKSRGFRGEVISKLIF